MGRYPYGSQEHHLEINQQTHAGTYADARRAYEQGNYRHALIAQEYSARKSADARARFNDLGGDW